LTGRDLKLKDILILFDRDSGVSIFQNFRGYDNPVDDAEWILERNPKTKGFILRPVNNGDESGLWIGEYTHNGISITRYEILYDKNAIKISSLIEDYANRKVTDRELIGKLKINFLKKKLNSKIIRDFKYYECPVEYFFYTCNEVKRIYGVLKKKYGEERVPYSKIADEILLTVKCPDAVICPLRVSNAFERIYNLNRSLKIRRIGEIKFISPGIVQLI